MSDDGDGPGVPEDEDRLARPAGSIAGLASELVELARNEPDKLATRIATLTVREQAELALRLPARQRLELLLNAPQPMRLVRSLPDSDFYLTVREIGPTDALALLALGSVSQLHHVLDLESWRADRFDPRRAGAWVTMLLEAGEPPLRLFLRNADDELLTLLFKQWIRVEAIETDEPAEIKGTELGESGDEQGWVTPDGQFRFQPIIAEHLPAIRRLLQIFFQEQPARYREVLWASIWELPSEVEEQALRWRQSRLEEHGYPGPEDALTVYAPPAGHRAAPKPVEPADADGLSCSRSPLSELGARDNLAQTIDRLPDTFREQVLHGVVSTANHVLIADGTDTGDPDSHRLALRKVAAYVGIALKTRGAIAPAATARILQQVPVIELFREGFARAVALQRRTRALLDAPWGSELPRWFDLLDSPLAERLEALLEPRPLYYEIGTQERPGGPREFRSPGELEETMAALEMVEVAGKLLLERLDVDLSAALRVAERSGHPLRLSTLLRTLLAWHVTRNEGRADPLPDDVVADFLRNYVSRRTAAPDAAGRGLQSLIESVTQTAGLDSREIAVVSAFGRFCLEELLQQCAGLDPGVPVDPRYVSSLLLEPRD